MPPLPVVLITGCSSGIGLHLARRFARAGYRVFASVRRDGPSCQALRDEAAAAGWQVQVPILDVTEDASVAAAVDFLFSQTGGQIDVLVNNAGYYLFGPVEHVTPDELRAQLETNVIGVLRVTRAVLPAMRKAGSGSIVNLSSVSGLVVLPVVGPYHASKFALEALTESLRYEVAPFGIRVTCVEPGPFATELHHKEQQAQAASDPASPYAPLIARYHQQLNGLPRGDVAEVVDIVFRAATHPRPRLRWSVGPQSFLARLRGLVPDALYELGIQFAFRWRRRSKT